MRLGLGADPRNHLVSVVSDTGPLIALAKVDLLPLLSRLFGRVSTPRPLFYSSCWRDADRNPLGWRKPCRGVSIQVETAFTMTKVLERLTDGWGAGEQQAIGLALHLREALIIDERSGRLAAKQLGIKITGTIGVVLQAKQAGLISLRDVRTTLDQIRLGGYWIAGPLIEEATSLAGE